MSIQYRCAIARNRIGRRQVLSGLASTGLLLAGAHDAFGDALNSNAALDSSITWAALFKEQISRCWKKPNGEIETQRVQVEFSIKLKKDGTLEAMPLVVTKPTSEYQRAFMESGLRAIVDCAPYRLPQASFEEWKFFNPVFDSRNVS